MCLKLISQDWFTSWIKNYLTTSSWKNFNEEVILRFENWLVHGKEAKNYPRREKRQPTNFQSKHFELKCWCSLCAHHDGIWHPQSSANRPGYQKNCFRGPSQNYRTRDCSHEKNLWTDKLNYMSWKTVKMDITQSHHNVNLLMRTDHNWVDTAHSCSYLLNTVQICRIRQFSHVICLVNIIRHILNNWQMYENHDNHAIEKGMISDWAWKSWHSNADTLTWYLGWWQRTMEIITSPTVSH